MRMKPPQHYVDRAVAHQDKGEWEQAIACWNSARAASIGHGRRDRYEEAADDIARKHGVERHHNYAETMR